MKNIRADSAVLSYVPLPRFIFNLPISANAKLIYARLYHRALLSKSKGWLDEYGNIFIIYPTADLSRDSGCSERTAKKALNELSQYDLITRKRCGGGKANRIYVKIPLWDAKENLNDDYMKLLLM